MYNAAIEYLEDECNFPIDEEWNFGTQKEFKMHNVHSYPAKFPAFIASKVFDYAKSEGVKIKKVADVFCGCGTVGLESQLNGFDFWGCDINPTATLIANVKSKNYSLNYLEKYYELIIRNYENIKTDENLYNEANERLKYWFKEKTYTNLFKLKNSILSSVPKGKYQNAFLCIFSSILKLSSNWLNKSIKPQIDPLKKEIDVLEIFKKQYKYFIKASAEIKVKFKNEAKIKNANFLTFENIPNVDLIVTSPPYVTSYEYADLHQLSSLWLDYTNDYKTLRKGSVGSVYNSADFNIETSTINTCARNITEKLSKVLGQARLKAVTRYYQDMELALKKSYNILNKNGMIFLVVGDTEYKGVKIENSKHLIWALKETGFEDIKVARRKISYKSLTPYRDENGKFTSDKTKRTIYHEEFLISGRKF